MPWILLHPENRMLLWFCVLHISKQYLYYFLKSYKNNMFSNHCVLRAELHLLCDSPLCLSVQMRVFVCQCHDPGVARPAVSLSLRPVALSPPPPPPPPSLLVLNIYSSMGNFYWPSLSDSRLYTLVSFKTSVVSQEGPGLLQFRTLLSRKKWSFL